MFGIWKSTTLEDFNEIVSYIGELSFYYSLKIYLPTRSQDPKRTEPFLISLFFFPK